MPQEKLLIAEDEEGLRWALGRLFGDKGIPVELAADGTEALKKLADREVGAALIDIMMPGVDGLELLLRARQINPEARIIIMTAHSSMENAVAAMQGGAFDFLAKPFEIEEAERLVEKAFRAGSLLRELSSIPRGLYEKIEVTPRLIGKSRAMVEVFKTIGRVSRSDATVLITGESGTGKELVARAIHFHSLRYSRPFVPVNCAAIPQELLEAELFGYERGAFTGALTSKHGKLAQSDGGTLFLDEIGDMPLKLQAKVLRVLQEKEFEPLGSTRSVRVDVRFIAATNQDLEARAGAGQFRKDLLYRVNVVNLKVPPLRERRDDIPVLAENFMALYSRELGGGPRFLSPEGRQALEEYHWPGNVRELENVIKRALVLSSQPTIGAEELWPPSAATSPARSREPHGLEEILEKEIRGLFSRPRGTGFEGVYDFLLKVMERPLLKVVLEKTAGNKVKAARLLGINRNTLNKKLKLHRLPTHPKKRSEEE